MRCVVSSILFTADAYFTLSRRTYCHHTRTQQPVLQWDYYRCRVVTGASIMREVTACQLLLASSLSGPIRLTSPYNSVTAKSVTVPLGISTSVLRQERSCKTEAAVREQHKCSTSVTVCLFAISPPKSVKTINKTASRFRFIHWSLELVALMW